MNIFILDSNIKKCAQYHMDKHAVKMILESTQILSTASRLLGCEQGYEITHQKHPSVLWVRESKANWLWLRSLALELVKEHFFRYRTQVHKSYQVLKNLQVPDNFKEEKHMSVKLAMPNKFKCLNLNPIEAYRTYYLFDKKHLANWRLRPKPFWWFDVDENKVSLEDIQRYGLEKITIEINGTYKPPLREYISLTESEIFNYNRW